MAEPGTSRAGLHVGVFTLLDMNLAGGDWLRVVGPAQHLAELGCRATLIAPNFPEALRGKADFEPVRGRRGQQDPYRRLLLLQAAWRPLFQASKCLPVDGDLAGIFNGLKLDLIHCHQHSGGLRLLRVLDRLKAPVALDVHTIYRLQLEEGGGLRSRWARRVTLSGESALFRGMDALIVESAAEREFLAREYGIAAERIHVAASGADTDFLCRPVPEAEKSALRAELGLGRERVVLFAGGFKAQSGVMDLVQAFRILGPGRPDVRLVTIGDVSEVTLRVRAYVRQHGLSNVIMLGPQSRDRYRVYQQIADVLVVPDIDSAFTRLFPPLKLYDVLASGRPAVATRVPGRTEMVQEGVTGYLVNPGDPPDLARGMQRALDDPDAGAVAARARDLMIAKHSWRKSAEALADTYAAIVRAG